MWGWVKELIKPKGIYSSRRFIALVATFLITVVVICYLVYPRRYDNATTVITVLCGVAGVGTAAASLKRYD